MVQIIELTLQECVVFFAPLLGVEFCRERWLEIHFIHIVVPLSVENLVLAFRKVVFLVLFVNKVQVEKGVSVGAWGGAGIQRVVNLEFHGVVLDVDIIESFERETLVGHISFGRVRLQWTQLGQELRQLFDWID